MESCRIQVFVLYIILSYNFFVLVCFVPHTVSQPIAQTQPAKIQTKGFLSLLPQCQTSHPSFFFPFWMENRDELFVVSSSFPSP